MWITRVSIRNPVFATMVMVGIAVLGLFAYNRLQVEQMPDVNLPFVLVLTNYPGANPEVVETDVTKIGGWGSVTDVSKDRGALAGTVTLAIDAKGEPQRLR